MLILVVDDEPSLLHLIGNIFLSDGWEVLLADTGHDALGMLEAHPSPDAIVLDMSMAVMDGRMLFREIRGRGVESPVLVLSAYGAREAQQELGADGYLEKPFDVDDLMARVTSLTNGRGVGEGPP